MKSDQIKAGDMVRITNKFTGLRADAVGRVGRLERFGGAHSQYMYEAAGIPVSIDEVERVDEPEAQQDPEEHPVWRALDKVHALQCHEFNDQFEDIIADAMNRVAERLDPRV